MTHGGFAVRNAPDMVGTSLQITFRTPPVTTTDGNETRLPMSEVHVVGVPHNVAGVMNYAHSGTIRPRLLYRKADATQS